MKELEALEIWKDIECYEGIYQISNLGNVKSLPRLVKNKNGYRKVQGGLLKTCLNSKGYVIVPLTTKQKSKFYFVHRLIANAFIPNHENKPYINHKDCNQKNNNIENLEWCTQKENVNHAIKNGRYENVFRVAKTKRPEHNKHLRKNIIQKDLEGNFIKQWNGIIRASKELNLDSRGLSHVLNGKQKTCGGYIWEFVQ